MATSTTLWRRYLPGDPHPNAWVVKLGVATVRRPLAKGLARFPGEEEHWWVVMPRFSLWVGVLVIPGMALVPLAVSAQTPKAPAKSSPSSKSAPSLAVMPGFETLADGSTRLFVDSSGPVAYETRTDSGSTSYVLKDTRVAKQNNCNPLVTEFFNTPVTTARLVVHGRDLVVRDRDAEQGRPCRLGRHRSRRRRRLLRAVSEGRLPSGVGARDGASRGRLALRRRHVTSGHVVAGHDPFRAPTHGRERSRRWRR